MWEFSSRWKPLTASRVFTDLLLNSPKNSPQFSPGYEGTENMFYFFNQSLFKEWFIVYFPTTYFILLNKTRWSWISQKIWQRIDISGGNSYHIRPQEWKTRDIKQRWWWWLYSVVFNSDLLFVASNFVTTAIKLSWIWRRWLTRLS